MAIYRYMRTYKPASASTHFRCSAPSAACLWTYCSSIRVEVPFCVMFLAAWVHLLCELKFSRSDFNMGRLHSLYSGFRSWFCWFFTLHLPLFASPIIGWYPSFDWIDRQYHSTVTGISVSNVMELSGCWKLLLQDFLYLIIDVTEDREAQEAWCTATFNNFRLHWRALARRWSNLVLCQRDLVAAGLQFLEDPWIRYSQLLPLSHEIIQCEIPTTRVRRLPFESHWNLSYSYSRPVDKLPFKPT